MEPITVLGESLAGGRLLCVIRSPTTESAVSNMRRLATPALAHRSSRVKQPADYRNATRDWSPATLITLSDTPSYMGHHCRCAVVKLADTPHGIYTQERDS